MKKIIFTLIVSPLIAVAQNYQADPYTLEGQGNLATIRMEMGGKKAKLFLVGKEAAELNLGKDAELLKITAFRKDGSKEELRFSPDRGYYSVDVPPEADAPYKFEVRTRVKDKQEDVRLLRR